MKKPTLIFKNRCKQSESESTDVLLPAGTLFVFVSDPRRAGIAPPGPFLMPSAKYVYNKQIFKVVEAKDYYN